MEMCRSNAELNRKCDQQLAKVSGSMFQEGLERKQLPALIGLKTSLSRKWVALWGLATKCVINVNKTRS